MNPSKVFIISTRSMLAPHCFLQVPPCKFESVDLDSPFVDYLMGETGMPGFLLDVYGDEEEKFPAQIKEKVRAIVPDDALFDDIDVLKKWLKEEGGADLIDLAFHDIWRKYELEELLPVVKGLPWNKCLKIDREDASVVAVQHLYAGPETVRRHEDSVAWVHALLDTFAPMGEDVCLILHDRDLDGYENRPYYLLSEIETKRYTMRQNVQIIVFTHSDNPVTRCLAESDINAFFSGILTLPALLAYRQKKNNLIDDL